MVDTLELYSFAEKRDVGVYWFSLDRAESLSFMDEDGCCHIAMDPWSHRSISEETVKLAHELGHCMTGSFYNKYATCDNRKRHENRADKWAIEHTISAEELHRAIQNGLVEIWSLAEHFGVTEEFMKKAVCYYTYGNLNVNLYF